MWQGLLSFRPHFFQQFSSLTTESTNPLHPSHPPCLQHPTSLLIMDSEFTENIKIIPEDSLYLHACMLSCFSRVRLFVTLWIVARQAPLSMGFSRQGYWSGLPCPLTQGSNPHLLCFLHWQVIFTTGATWEAWLPYLLPTNITSLSASVYRILLLAYFTKSI